MSPSLPATTYPQIANVIYTYHSNFPILTSGFQTSLFFRITYENFLDLWLAETYARLPE